MKLINRVVLFFVCLILPAFEVQASEIELEIGERYLCDVNDYGNNILPWSVYDMKWEFSDGLKYSQSLTSYTNYVWVDRYISGVLYAKVSWTETKLYVSDNIFLHKSHTWYFTVSNVPVNGVYLATPINIDADDAITISPSSQWMTITPSNGRVEDISWKSADPSVASISASGYLTGVNPGTTIISCTVNGSVQSNAATVIVSEPAFRMAGASVDDGATEVETKPTLSVTYSHGISQGSRFNDIALTDAQGAKVDGNVTISGKTLSFVPKRHLKPTAEYRFTVPAGAVKNKWGTAYASEYVTRFKTADWKRMSLSVAPEATYLTPGDEIVLTCDAPGAAVYYSLDGSEPAIRYEGPIVFSDDIALRAVARLDGYYDTDLLSKDYYRRLGIVEKFPSAEPLYVYANVNPYICFNRNIDKAGSSLGGISFKQLPSATGGEMQVEHRVILRDSTIYFVPEVPLAVGNRYLIELPEGCITSDAGESNQPIDFRFVAGNYATAVSTGGPELAGAVMTDGSLWTWGNRLVEANADDGSSSFDTQSVPSMFVDNDVVSVSSGYTHHALIKYDGTLWMWGRQLCGEFGNGSTTASAQPQFVMENVRSVSCGLQTTAIVKQDGSLWMCGRNDMGQIDTTRTVRKEFVKLMDGVASVDLGWGYMTVTKTNGTTETRTWDEKADGGREVGDGLLPNAASTQYGWQNAVALDPMGSVWTWGRNDYGVLGSINLGVGTYGSEAVRIIEGRIPQPLQGIVLKRTSQSIASGEQTVIAVKPVPLMADYNVLTFQSSDEAVATVDERGVVTAHKDGVAVVTVVITDDNRERYEAQCTINVGEATAISDIPVADTWQLKVVSGYRSLHIYGIPKGQDVMVYSASGSLVLRGQMSTDELQVATPQRGIYIVKSGRQVRKVATR